MKVKNAKCWLRKKGVILSSKAKRICINDDPPASSINGILHFIIYSLSFIEILYTLNFMRDVFRCLTRRNKSCTRMA